MHLICIVRNKKTLSFGFRYFATKWTDGKVEVMDDFGTILWVNRSNFREDR